MGEKLFWGAFASLAGYSFVRWAMLRRYDRVYQACGL